MSVIFYVVRQKKNKGMYYKRRGRGHDVGGWVNDVQRASVWGTYQGPHQVLALVGKENAEIVAVTGLMQPGEYNTVYAIRHRITGEFVANRGHRVKGIFYSKRWDDAGLWTKVHHAKHTIRCWQKFTKFPDIVVKPEELEIIKMPIFVPPPETI